MADRYVQLCDNTVVEIHNFAHSKTENEIIIIGYTFQKYDNFFTTPCPSSDFGIFKLSEKSTKLTFWNINNIKHKMIVLPYKSNKYFGVPLLHTAHE